MPARKDSSLRNDPVRKALAEQLRRNDLSMKHASLAIGRNPAYLHQYLTRGYPSVLGFRDSETLAELLGCGAEALRHKTVPPRKPVKRKPRASPPPGAPHCPIPEVAVEAVTGALWTKNWRGRQRAGTCPRRCSATRVGRIRTT